MSVACCVQGCGASVCFTPEVERRLRRTHEFWMCPFGHEQHFTQETDQERLTRYAEQARDNWRRIAEEREEAFGTCPFCGWRTGSAVSRRWLYLMRHFVKAHPDIIPPRALMAFYRAREEGAA